MSAVVLKNGVVTDAYKGFANRFNSRRQTLVQKILELSTFAAVATAATDSDEDLHSVLSQSLDSVEFKPCHAVQQVQRLFHVYVHFGLYVQVVITQERDIDTCYARLEPVFTRCEAALEEWTRKLLQIRQDAKLHVCF